MKLVKAIIASAIFLPLVGAPISSQAPGSPTLEVTLKFIGDLMVAESPVTTTMTATGGDQDSPRVHSHTASYSNFVQDGCVLRFQEANYGTHNVDFAKSSSIAVKIDTLATVMNRVEAREYHDGTVWSTAPEIYMVDGYTLISGQRTTDDGFELADRDKAERLLKAMNHAIELCGGAKDQPF